MRTRFRVMLGAAVAAALGAGVFTAVGNRGGAAHKPRRRRRSPMLYGTAPDYLDPQESLHDPGRRGQLAQLPRPLHATRTRRAPPSGDVIPALATAQPVVTDGGKTYTMTLRPNLVYSNGAKVKASDFTYSIERALKLNWGGDSFYTGNIVGAAAYQKRQGEDDLRHRRQRRDRQDHDPPARAVRRVPEHPRVPLVGLRPDRHADEEPRRTTRRPASGRT